MLISVQTLTQIKSGEVTLAFRRWRRPTVKSGGTLMTAVGMLSVKAVEKVSLQQITNACARQAGYMTRQSLIDDLKRREGPVFRITLSYAGPDPRIALRENTQLSEAELDELTDRLARMDARSKAGPWTMCTLAAIEKHPKALAADVASEVGMDKARFKTNVRKLKNLGLTISLQTGYKLSPLGVVVLEHLRNDG